MRQSNSHELFWFDCVRLLNVIESNRSIEFDYRTAVQVVTPGPTSGASTVQDINAGLVVFMTLKNKDGLSAAAHAQTDGYSLIKIRQHRQIRPD